MDGLLSSHSAVPTHTRPYRLLIIVAGVAALLLALWVPLFTWAVSGLEMAKREVSGGSYYNVAFLSANYLDLGFVRRGLGGSISRLFSTDPYWGGFLFHTLSAAFLIAPLAIVQHRLILGTSRSSALFMIVFIVASPQTFLAWAYDIARTDMLVIGLIAWSAIAALSHRYLVAATLLLIGFLAHETALVFGAPLLVAIGAMQSCRGEIDRRRLLGAFCLLMGGIALVAAVQSITTPSVEYFVASMMRTTPSPIDQWHRDLRDCAIYMMVMGMRGLRTAMCYNMFWQGYAVMVPLSLLLCVANGAALGLERAPRRSALAVLIPVLFMDAIANDIGRWVKFACVNAWLFSAVLQLNGSIAFTGRRLIMNYAILGVLLYCGSSPVHTVNRVSTSIVRRLGLEQQPEVAVWMTHCDPQWREAVGDRLP